MEKLRQLEGDILQAT